MDQYKEPATIADQLPEIQKKIICLSSSGRVNESIDMLTAHTGKMVRLHKLQQVYSCMNLANRLYITGNEPVKEAVEHVFVYSFYFLQLSCTKTEWGIIKNHIPGPLFAAYIHRFHT